MLIALPWGNLFGVEGASAFLVVLMFALPEPHLIYVAAFSFCSNFQSDFSKLSTDFMNLPPRPFLSFRSVGNTTTSPSSLPDKATIKPERDLRNEPKTLCFVEQNRRGFWWISICNELFTSSSLHGWRWFTEYYVQKFCVSVKKMPKDGRGGEQREWESLTGQPRQQ